MALNIKNEATVALVRELAEKTGQTQTSAIETAVREALERLGDDDHARRTQERYDRAMVIIREIHASMTDEEREALRTAEDDLYDENGLFK
ncbi:type II toxin-antitoxin system VapB family antitoxin [Demequina sp. NBRC 110056]|uniref:type II toxin-antitoxin system VapB family antitoxin n=1 Tax=Demequina sp. NBRC 110056 TaxID=1570345 RepID=UPI0013562BAE|nr:type II toxin-antitoxin system VapB family antitoxin [Demequina sp. NBRC 110056]